MPAMQSFPSHCWLLCKVSKAIIVCRIIFIFISMMWPLSFLFSMSMPLFLLVIERTLPIKSISASITYRFLLSGLWLCVLCVSGVSPELACLSVLL